VLLSAKKEPPPAPRQRRTSPLKKDEEEGPKRGAVTPDVFELKYAVDER
jgi:hypothetical protein